ncbi:MAG: glycosyltransferase [Alphaproteobacteria bacterium]
MRRVAIVTPYHGEPLAWIAKAHASVRLQSHPTTHILVGDGKPEAAVDKWDAQHIVMPAGHRDWGHTPRAIGALSAAAQGFDAIGFLDADNWLYPDHVATLLALQEKDDLEAASSLRVMHHVDGRLLHRCQLVDGIETFDTNCLMMFPPAYSSFAVFALVPNDVRYIADRWVSIWLKRRKRKIGCTNKATVAYRVRYRHFYETSTLPMPTEHIVDLDIPHPRELREWWMALPQADRDFHLRTMGAS